MRRSTAFFLTTLAMLIAATARGDEPALVPVGAATVDITPKTPVRLIGYASRKTESDGVESPLKVRAIAIGGDAEGPAILMAVDNCGVPATLSDDVAARLSKKVGVPRARIAVNSSHTHCGPCLSGPLTFQFGGPLAAEQQEHLDAYTRDLADAMETAALAALADRKPARLGWTRGTAGFAMNRRVMKEGKATNIGVNPAGPVDQTVPVLRAVDSNGAIRAVVVGYACHCTTLGGEFNKICGDWAGYACEAIEREHPGATALVVIGCGADANPEPRRGPGRRQGATGRSFAAEVARLLKGPITPLPGRVDADFRRIELPFGTPPTREHLTAEAKKPGPPGYWAKVHLDLLDGPGLPKTLTYPVQTWRFGDALAIVFLGGEVVVDYAIRINRECDANRLWIAAYSNDVPCYIASKRVLSEGGYEADSSMIYYGRPSRFAPAVEDLILETVHELLPNSFDTVRRP